MAAKQVHTGPHRYQRVRQSNRIIYRCMRDGCTHFMRDGFMEGLHCMCNRCGDEFVITRRTLNKGRAVKLHCENCTKKRDAPEEVMAPLPEESPI